MFTLALPPRLRTRYHNLWGKTFGLCILYDSSEGSERVFDRKRYIFIPISCASYQCKIAQLQNVHEQRNLAGVGRVMREIKMATSLETVNTVLARFSSADFELTLASISRVPSRLLLLN